MQESPFYELVMQRGIEQGARETTIENMLTVLGTRFSNADVNAIKPRLEVIADLSQLKKLSLEASLVPDFETFQRGLET